MSNYLTFSEFLSRHLPGKIQKLTIDAGFTCPNRDGTLSTGGCIYCNNSSFSPLLTHGAKSVSEQIERGRSFFGRKYPQMKYLAYFQSYTSTYGDTSRLLNLYNQALTMENVVGLVIGTRPDCMPGDLLDALSEMARKGVFILIEYGAETAHNVTLERINRCHTWECTANAVERTHKAGIFTGLHLINGLPGEDNDMIMQTIDAVNRLPVDIVKFHQLQVVRGTRLAEELANGLYTIPEYTVGQYVALCKDIIGRLRSDIAIERFVSQSPPDMLISPKWGLKNYEFTALLQKTE